SSAPRSMRHHVTSLRIEVSAPGEATSASYFLVVGDHGPDHWGRYRDRYTHRDGRWLFARRQVRVDGRAPSSAIAGRSLEVLLFRPRLRVVFGGRWSVGFPSFPSRWPPIASSPTATKTAALGFVGMAASGVRRPQRRPRLRPPVRRSRFLCSAHA